MKKLTCFLIAITLLAVNACKKADKIFEDPYANPKPPLGINMDRDIAPSPSSGIAGTAVHFQATGLIPYKDKLTFMFNGEKAEITAITASGIDVKVPATASSGVSSISVEDQLVLGPQFSVIGFVKIDHFPTHDANIFPLLVFGNPETNCILSGFAIAPITRVTVCKISFLEEFSSPCI